MGFRQRVGEWFSAAPVQALETVEQFGVDSFLPTDQLLLHAYSRIGDLDRIRAMSVAAVFRGRNLICSLATLPLHAVDERNRIVNRQLFRQLDPHVPNVVLLSQLVEDLLFESVAWLRVTGFGEDGFPSRVKRYSPDQVSLQPPKGYQHGRLPSGLAAEGVVYMEGKPVPVDQVIRFDSTNPALLVAGAEPIRRAIALKDAATLYASTPRRRGYLKPSSGADPTDKTKAQQAVNQWAESSRLNVDGYLGAGLEYVPIQDSTPAELQLIQMERQASLDVANVMGIDPEDLGISTVSRTYLNGTDRRQDRINDVLMPFIRAIQDRLSMQDMMPEGQKARFWLDDYLKADPKTRAEVQQIYLSNGVTTIEEIRQDEGLPPLPPGARPAPVRVPSIQGDPVPQLQASAELSADDGLTFECDAVTESFTVDEAKRTITGLAIPWNESAYKNGRFIRFARGGQRFTKMERIKFLEDHDWKLSFGQASAIQDTDEGLKISFRVARGEHGDRMLSLAADGAKDGLSVGVVWDPSHEQPDPLRRGGVLVTQYQLRETSLLANPAFDSSRLTSVTASTDDQKETGMPDEILETVPAAPVTLSAEQFSALVARGETPQPQRQVVDPTAVVPMTSVNEALPYRFHYSPGESEGNRYHFATDAEHDFSRDIFSIINTSGGDHNAVRRVNSLVQAAFDTDRADLPGISPNVHRPDLWVPQADYPTPLWDLMGAGTVDERPFDVPQFSSSGGLVSSATEGTEPAVGTFVTKMQTVTPGQVWGKIELTRQAARRMSSPQLSGILWDQMLREYYEDREAYLATFLNGLTAATDITLPGVDASPDNTERLANASALEAAIASLQFDRGGAGISAFAVHRALYLLLVQTQDTTGRPLYSRINPTNANGTTSGRFTTMNIGGVDAVPAYGLDPAAGANASVNSWLFDPRFTKGWASAPERLDWNFGATVQTSNIPQLSHVTVGIYGNVAAANLDISTVRQVIFDKNTAA